VKSNGMVIFLNNTLILVLKTENSDWVSVDDVTYSQNSINFLRDPNNKKMKGDIGGAAW